jgi:uncharacterized protein YkuJ
MIEPSKIHLVKIVGDRDFEIIKSFRVNQGFLFTFDYEQTQYVPRKNGEVIHEIEYFLSKNIFDLDRKHDKKLFYDCMKFLLKLKKWDENSYIVFDEGVNHYAGVKPINQELKILY